MKIEFFDKETGNIIPDYIKEKDCSRQYVVGADGVVIFINTEKWNEVWFQEDPAIGWRVVEEEKEQELIVDWSKVPEQYKWAAMDENEIVFVYSREPFQMGNLWASRSEAGFIDPNYALSKPSPDKWRESLIQRPEGV